MLQTDTVCQCGDRSRPHINHRMRVPCWTYLGDKRYDVDKDGRIAMMHYEIESDDGVGHSTEMPPPGTEMIDIDTGRRFVVGQDTAVTGDDDAG